MTQLMTWRNCFLLLVACALVAPLSAQIGQDVVCEDLTLNAGESVAIQCMIEGYGESDVVFRWQSAEAAHLRLLSNPAVLTPVFAAPTDVKRSLQITYFLAVHTADGLLLEDAQVQVTVQPACLQCSDDVIAPAPPQVQCPATLNLDERETASILCRATEPASGQDASLLYTWTAGGGVTLYPPDAPNPTVVAPAVPYGQQTLLMPLTLAVTSRLTQQTTLTRINLVVNARAPFLECPEQITLAAGASTVIACQGTDPINGIATYTWTGLWGSSIEPLSATDLATPIFSAPVLERDTTFHYVVSMGVFERTTRHRVSINVLGRSSADGPAHCEAMALYELDQKPLQCRVPEGYRIRWRGPNGPAAPILTQEVLTAPQVLADTTFEYFVEFCNDKDGACIGGMPWVVTVLNQKPPAVTCPVILDTYAGEPDLLLNCAVSGGTVYEFIWTGPDSDRLSATDVLSPTFDVPDQVEEDRQYAYTLTVTDKYIGSSSTDVRIQVRKRGEVVLACEGLDYYVYVGSADFPLQLQCAASGAAVPTEPYTYRWHAQRSVRDTERLSSTTERYPIFDVPDTLAAPYVYEYSYVVGARYSNPASATVRVHVSPFPAEFDMSISTVAVRFGEQSVGSEAVLDPSTGTISTKVRGPHNVGRMIFAADKDLDVELSLSGGTLVSQESEDVVQLRPQWSAALSCLAPNTEALRSDHAAIKMRSVTGGCTVVNFGGELDLRDVRPGHYTGTLEVAILSGEVQESNLVPVFVTVVDPGRAVNTGPKGTFLGDAGQQQLTDAQALSVHPSRVLLTADQPYGTFTVSNPSRIAQEVLVRLVFGFMEASDSDATESMVFVPTDAVHDLSDVLLLYPKVFTLSPGQSQQVHYAVREDKPLLPKAYASQIEFNSRPRRYVHADLLPVPDDSSRVALVSLLVQGAYIPAQGATSIAATILSASQGTILLEAADGPFEGEIVAVDPSGNELGRRSLLLLTRRILHWPMNPEPDGELTLLFETQHGSAPPPVILSWE